MHAGDLSQFISFCSHSSLNFEPHQVDILSVLDGITLLHAEKFMISKEDLDRVSKRERE